MHQVHLLISGRVQGVFYRTSCEEVAIRHGLTGWVKNLPSEQVEVLAQGEKEKIEKLIEWCKKGPPNASVSSVEVKWEELLRQFTSFEIT